VKAKTSRLKRWLKILAVTALVLIVVGYVTYRPVFRAAGNFLVVVDQPVKSDAIVVLAGGDPARPFEAVQLYKAGFAPWVVVTTERPPRVYEELKKDGIFLNQNYENYLKVIEGYGVPADHFIRVESYVNDTLDEMQAIKKFAQSRGWKSLLIVTSNFHTRRAKMVSRYVMEPDIRVTMVAASKDSFDPSTWFESQASTRTFVIEVEKLVTYKAYLWPRMMWGRK
jgi:uncharacterized SAM-binding protein YcdF (DUF218 family)